MNCVVYGMLQRLVIPLFVMICFLIPGSGYAQDTPAKLWGPDGIKVVSQENFGTWIHAVSDGSGGAIFMWDDRRPPPAAPPGIDRTVRMQRFDENGIRLWDEEDVVLAGRNKSLSSSGSISSDGQGGAVVSWIEYDSDNSRLYVQRIDGSGKKKWFPGGIPIDMENAHGRAIGDGQGGALVIWGGAGQDVRVQRIDSQGLPMWGLDGVLVHSGGNIVPDGEGGGIISWSKDLVYYAQRVDGNGEHRWPAAGVLVSSQEAYYSSTHFLLGDGQGGAIVIWVWEVPDKTYYYRVYSQRLNSDGVLQWGLEDVVVSPDAYILNLVDSLMDGEGGAVVAWRADGGVYLQRIDDSGLSRWAPGGVRVSTNYWSSLKVASDGAGGAIGVWGSSKDLDGEFGIGIWAQRIGEDGGLLWPPDGHPVAYWPGYHTVPSPGVISDGAGGIIAYWAMEGNVTAQRLTDHQTAPVTRTLRVDRSGKGAGTVTSAPSGIACGEDCWEAFPRGTEVTLEAAAGEGSVFTGWRGDPDCSDGAVTMDVHGACTADFRLLVPEISVSPESKEFGGVDVGLSSGQIFNAANVGLVDLAMGTITITGPYASSFTLSGNICDQAILAPAQDCQFEVDFKPTSPGAKTAQIAIASNDPDRGALIVPLTGIGLKQDIAVEPTQVALGAVKAGESSIRVIKVRNDGNRDLTLGDMRGPEAPFGRTGGTCDVGTVLSPAEECTLEVMFSPVVAGSFGSSLGIESDDPDTPLATVTLSGGSGPDLALDWLNYDNDGCADSEKGCKCKVKKMLIVSNGGTQDAPSSSLHIYLSGDTVYDPGDLLVKKISIGAIKVEGVRTKKFSLRLLLEKGTPRKYIIAVLDPEDRVEEARETNNQRVIDSVP
jgi:hypothetical protein